MEVGYHVIFTYIFQSVGRGYFKLVLFFPARNKVKL